jgi:hypothetical protein
MPEVLPAGGLHPLSCYPASSWILTNSCCALLCTLRCSVCDDIKPDR